VSHASDAVRARFPPGTSPFRIKGVTYRNFVDYVEQEVEGGLARLASEVRDPELRAFAGQTFLPSGWYDTLPIVQLCNAAALAKAQPARGFVQGLSRFAAERDTKGVYRFLLRLVSADLVMSRTPAAAKQYFDFVNAKADKLADKAYRTTVTGVPDFVSQFYMTVTESFLIHALTLAGARELAHRWLPSKPDGEREGVPLVLLQREISWA
jgi:hypothetical protein